MSFTFPPPSAITLGFRDVADLPQWRQVAESQLATGAGMCLAFDKRNSEDRDPHIYLLGSAARLDRYNIKNDEWFMLSSPGLATILVAGAFAEFAASAGPSGVVGAGNTTTTINLTTALPAAVGANQLANRGDGIGYEIRIYGNIAGSSGTTEKSFIVANTAGTTPTLTISPALTFTPASGCRFEILSGRVLLCSAGTLAAGIARVYDIATNSYITISQVNLPATIGTDSSAVMLDELYVPHNRQPGEGFFGNLTATGIAATTITGHATGGDAGVLANEYRNFQIRIVRDTAIPAAVGQRRIIASHTGGASPVYTLASAWTTTPSANALYVIENNNDLLLWSSASANTFSYRLGGFTADGTWSVSGTPGTNGAIAYAARPVAMGLGCTSFPSYGIVLDTPKNARHSFVYSFRGGATAILDLLDISGGANGLWTTDIMYGGRSLATTFTTGTSGAYDAVSRSGRYGYINHNAGRRFMRFDVLNRTLESWAYLSYTQGIAVVGGKVAVMPYIDIVDPTRKVGFLFAIQSTGLVFWNCLIQR